MILQEKISGRAPRDHVDHILEQWGKARSDLDVSPMAVVGRMSRLARFLERSTATVLATYGLKEPQFAVLAALRRSGPPYRLAPTDLYNTLMISSGAMTNRLARLAAAGLIERVPDARDGRSLLIALTDKGHALIDQAVVAHTVNEHRHLAVLSAEDRDWLAGVLRALLVQFGDRPRLGGRRGAGRRPAPPPNFTR